MSAGCRNAMTPNVPVFPALPQQCTKKQGSLPYASSAGPLRRQGSGSEIAMAGERVHFELSEGEV